MPINSALSVHCANSESKEAGTLTGCKPSFCIFPTTVKEHQCASDSPVIFALLVAVMFAVSIFLFASHGKHTMCHQNKVEKEASWTNTFFQIFFLGACGVWCRSNKISAATMMTQPLQKPKKVSTHPHCKWISVPFAAHCCRH